MAIYHLKVTTGSKLKGASGTIRCDYITRQGVYADREEELVLAESGNLPSWARDERHFWEAADTYERRNGRVYNEVEVALPRELSREQQIELAREFVSDLMTPSRLPYTMAIHDRDGHNPHAHVIYSERGDDGVAREMEQHFRRADRAKPWKGGAPKDTSMRGSEWVKQVRKDWEIAANVALERAGESARVDCRSYKERGIARTPQLHLGVAAAAMLRRGVQVDRVASYVRIERIRQLEREIEEELRRARASVREEVDKVGREADEGGEASTLSLSPITKAGESELVSAPEGEARGRSMMPPRLPPRSPAGQGRGAAGRLFPHEVSPDPHRGPTGALKPSMSHGVGGGGAPGSSPGDLDGASERQGLALSVMKSVLDRAPKDVTWKEFADSLKQASVVIVPEGTQGDFGKIRGLYFEHDGIRLPASDVDRGASYGQLTRALGPLTRAELSDVCDVVAVAGVGDVPVMIAEREHASRRAPTGEALALPAYVEREIKSPKQKFDEELAKAMASSTDREEPTGRELVADLPPYIEREIKGPMQKFIEDLAKTRAGEWPEVVAVDPALEARLPAYKDFTPVGPREKFLREVKERLGEEALEQARGESPDIKHVRRGAARAVIGEIDRVVSARERTADEELIARVGGRDLLAGMGQRGTSDDADRESKLPRGSKELPYTRREIEARVARITNNKPRADVSKEPFKGHIKDAFYNERGDKIAVIEGPKQVALIKVDPRDGRIGADALVVTEPTDRGLVLSVHARGEKENPHSHREVAVMLERQATPRISPETTRMVGQVQRTMHVEGGQKVAIIGNSKEHAVVPLRADQEIKRGDQVESRPDGRGGVEVKSAGYALDQKQAEEKLAKLSKEPAKLTERPAPMQVKEVFVMRGKGEVAIVADDKRHAVVPTAGLGDRLAVGERVNVSAGAGGKIEVARAPVKTHEEAPATPERGQEARAPESKTEPARDGKPAPAPTHGAAERLPNTPAATLRTHGQGKVPTTGRAELSRDQAIEKAKATGTEKLRPNKVAMEGKVVEKFVVRGKGEAALVVNDKNHTIIYTKGREDKLEVGKHVALSPDGKGGVKVEPVKAVEKAVAEQNKPAPAPSNPSTTQKEREAPGTQTPGTSYHSNDALSRAQVIEKAKATGTEQLRPDREPMEGKVVERFVIRGKGEAALVVNDKKHAIIYTEGRGNKLEVGKHVALSPDGKGDVKVEPVKAVENGVAEKRKPVQTPLSERAQPARSVEEKQNGRTAAPRVEAEVKLKAPAPSAIDRAKAGEDGEPPAKDQRPTMKEWIAAQKERGIEASAPIERGEVRGKVEREPVYLKEGKHYVISQDDGSKKLDASPKLEEHRGKETKLMRNESDDRVSTLEKSRGLSR